MLAFTLAGSFLLVCGYFGTTSVTAVLFLTIAVGSLGLALSGFNCNHLDIAPRYGGVLMGITNAVATIPGIVGPYVAKAIAHQVTSLPSSFPSSPHSHLSLSLSLSSSSMHNLYHKCMHTPASPACGYEGN